MKSIDDWKRELARPASILQVGGFRPTGNPRASHFGQVLRGAPGEPWPEWRGSPLWPLCQLNLTDAPFRQEALNDIALLCLFIAADYYGGDQPWLLGPGEGRGAFWCLRAYETIDGLAPLDPPAHGSTIRPFEARWSLCEADYPTYDLLPADMPELLRERYPSLDWAATADGTKLGGWPGCIQSEPWWDYDAAGAEFNYAFQIDTEDKANWIWGDTGTAYFARSRENPDKWAFDWQCM